MGMLDHVCEDAKPKTKVSLYEDHILIEHGEQYMITYWGDYLPYLHEFIQECKNCQNCTAHIMFDNSRADEFPSYNLQDLYHDLWHNFDESDENKSLILKETGTPYPEEFDVFENIDDVTIHIVKNHILIQNLQKGHLRYGSGKTHTQAHAYECYDDSNKVHIIHKMKKLCQDIMDVGSVMEKVAKSCKWLIEINKTGIHKFDIIYHA